MLPTQRHYSAVKDQLKHLVSGWGFSFMPWVLQRLCNTAVDSPDHATQKSVTGLAQPTKESLKKYCYEAGTDSDFGKGSIAIIQAVEE